jgi:hypothetical protein
VLTEKEDILVATREGRLAAHSRRYSVHICKSVAAAQPSCAKFKANVSRHNVDTVRGKHASSQAPDFLTVTDVHAQINIVVPRNQTSVPREAKRRARHQVPVDAGAMEALRSGF